MASRKIFFFFGIKFNENKKEKKKKNLREAVCFFFEIHLLYDNNELEIRMI